MRERNGAMDKAETLREAAATARGQWHDGPFLLSHFTLCETTRLPRSLVKNATV